MFPAHTLVDVAVADTLGRLFTVTVTTAVFEHEPAEPVTVYVCVEDGVKATLSVTPPVQA